jgi:hypothetical protein
VAAPEYHPRAVTLSTARPGTAVVPLARRGIRSDLDGQAAARPFFRAAAADAEARAEVGVAPPDGLWGSPSDSGTGLEWYAVA